jgi:5-methylcytosine-specific restriction enzyme subunit McrC
METYVVAEYGSLNIKDYVLTEKEREYLNNMMRLSTAPPFKWYEMRNGLHFEFSSWIGVLELERVRIVIKPKFNRGFHDVVDMLLFCEDLPLSYEHTTVAAYDSHSLIEMIARLFAKEVEIILNKGIVKEYIVEEDNLTCLRGRVDIRQHLRTNFMTPAKVYCRYDELDTNVLENQVIRTALEIAKHFSLTKQTMRQINRLADEFMSMTDLYFGYEWPDFSYHRLNRHYENAHKLAYYIWRQIYVNQLYQFQHQSHYSYLIDMNELFEKFVAKLLKKYLPGAAKVQTQRRFKKAITRNGEGYHDIILDLLVEFPGKDPIVLDTKYKQYGKYKVANADIYQLAFYAQFVTKSNYHYKAIIVYPEYAGEDACEEVIDLLPGTCHQGKLFVKPVSIEKVLAAVKRKDMEFLQKQAEKLIL